MARSQAFCYGNKMNYHTVPAAPLTCHDPLGLVGFHVASTLPLSCFALEVILGIKGIRVVVSYGHLQGAGGWGVRPLLAFFCFTSAHSGEEEEERGGRKRS